MPLKWNTCVIPRERCLCYSITSHSTKLFCWVPLLHLLLDVMNVKLPRESPLKQNTSYVMLIYSVLHYPAISYIHIRPGFFRE